MNGNKYLLDSNILIYIAKGFIDVDDVINDSSKYFISVISYMEVLGYPFDSVNQENKMRLFLEQFSVVELSFSIIEGVIKLKQRKKIKLPDAIICITAIENKYTLISNDKRLISIPGLNLKLQSI